MRAFLLDSFREKCEPLGMSTSTMNTPRASTNQVTREEIAQIEKILTFIDLKNTALANVSQWLLLWSEVRDFSDRYAQSSDAIKANVGDDFKSLLERFIQIGKMIGSTLQKLHFSSEEIVRATGCDLESFDACIEFLNDKIIQWFDSSVSDARVLEIWTKAA